MARWILEQIHDYWAKLDDDFLDHFIFKGTTLFNNYFLCFVLQQQQLSGTS